LSRSFYSATDIVTLVLIVAEQAAAETGEKANQIRDKQQILNKGEH
jgi:phosphoribosylaminoimidazole-succinocarboxamide synthase